MWGFLVGIGVGAVWIWIAVHRARRQLRRAEGGRQRLALEREMLLEFMHSMVEGVGEDTERPGLYRRIVHEGIEGTGSMSASYLEWNGKDQLRLRARAGLFPPLRPFEVDRFESPLRRSRLIEAMLREDRFDAREGLLARVIRSGEGVLIEEPAYHPDIPAPWHPDFPLTSLMVAPVFSRNRLLGLLLVANPVHGGKYNPGDLALLTSLAEQAGLAIHNLELLAIQVERQKLDLDLSLARNVQGMLLPGTFPSIDGLEVAAAYLPAQQVGGDLYNVFDLGDRKVGVAIADVSGKGISASLLMAICQTHLSHCVRRGHSPAAVLQRMNELMNRGMRQDMFVTAIYAVIDLNADSITVARAGHEPPLLLRAGNEGSLRVETIASEGMAIGMVPGDIFDAVVEEVTLPFAAGDGLLLFTDGVTEMTNPSGAEYSDARLHEQLASLGGESAKGIQEAILRALALFRGSAFQPDDLTMLTVRRTPSP